MSDEVLRSLHDDATEVQALAKRIGRLLYGKPDHVQGMALADLLAMWLAGHVCPGNPEETDRYRRAVLETHLVAVRGLIDINYKMVVEPQLKAMKQ